MDFEFSKTERLLGVLLKNTSNKLALCEKTLEEENIDIKSLYEAHGYAVRKDCI